MRSVKLENPFLITGYEGHEYFCDREKEVAALVRDLDNDWNVTSLSPRRYGKTSLIHQTLHLLSQRKNVRAVYVDLYPTKCLADFVRVFARAVAESIETPVEKALKAVSEFARGFRPTMSFDGFTGKPEFSFDIRTDNDLFSHPG